MVVWEIYKTWDNKVLATCNNGSEALDMMHDITELYHEMGIGLFPLRARPKEVACSKVDESEVE